MWYIFTYFFATLQVQYGNVTLSHPSLERIALFSVICAFNTYGIQVLILAGPSLALVEVYPFSTKVMELKWPAPSPEEAITYGNPLKRSTISSATTLENLQINTCTIEYTRGYIQTLYII
jgi:hypothetical protein